MPSISTAALFDTNYYLQNNPDVAAAITLGQFADARDHFNKFGQFENRAPNIDFNGVQYLIIYPDVAAAVASKQIASAWLHFVNFGIAELRSGGVFSGPFDDVAYLAANPDVAAAVKAGSFIDGYQHFLIFGQNENRNGTPTLANGRKLPLPTGINKSSGLGGGASILTIAAVNAANNAIKAAADATAAAIVSTNAAQTANNAQVALSRAQASLANAQKGIDQTVINNAQNNVTSATATANSAAQIATAKASDAANAAAAATLAAANAVAAASAAGIVVGTFTGTPGAGVTLTIGGSPNGSDYANTLQISDAATTPATTGLTGVTLANIQTIALQNTGGASQTFDLTSYPTVTKVVALNGGTDVFTGLATGTQVVASGTSASASSTVKFAMTTPTDAVSVGVDAGTSGVTFINTAGSATTATIASTGTANGSPNVDTFGLTSGARSITALAVSATSNLAAALLNTDYVATGAALTVSGTATTVDVGSNGNFRTIDASGLTAGGLTVGLGTNTASFKGGASGNVVTTAAVAATVAASINAGAGQGNVLVVQASTDVDTAAKSQLYAGFSTLSVGGGVAVDVSKLTSSTITTEIITGNATLNNLSAAQAAAVTVKSSAQLGVAFSLNSAGGGQNDTLNLTVNPGGINQATTLGKVTVSYVKTINVNVVGSSNTANISALTSDAALSNLNFSGDGNAYLVFGSQSSVPRLTIDASHLSGKLSYLASGSALGAPANAIIGSIGVNFISLNNSSGNTVDLSANSNGSSTVVVGKSSDVTINLGTHVGGDQVLASNRDTMNSSVGSFTRVNNFNLGDRVAVADLIGAYSQHWTVRGDNLPFATDPTLNSPLTASVTNGVLTFNANSASLTDLITAAEFGLGSTNSTALAFEFGGSTYVIASPSALSGSAIYDHVTALNGVIGVTHLMAASPLITEVASPDRSHTLLILG